MGFTPYYLSTTIIQMLPAPKYTVQERGRYNLVEWEVTQLRKEQGGLGIKNLEIQNRCLLMKWLWRFCDEETSLWKEVIIQKFGQNSPWCSNEVNCTNGTGV